MGHPLEPKTPYLEFCYGPLLCQVQILELLGIRNLLCIKLLLLTQHRAYLHRQTMPNWILKQKSQEYLFKNRLIIINQLMRNGVKSI